jgi:hypothetical protein
MAKKLVETRLMRGAVAGLNTDELDHFSGLMDVWSTDPNANPTPKQQAAFDAYLRHYQDFLTTGRVQTVSGHAVDYSGEWPQAAGTTVGYFPGCIVWIEGIGYCLDLHLPRHP